MDNGMLTFLTNSCGSFFIYLKRRSMVVKGFGGRKRVGRRVLGLVLVLMLVAVAGCSKQESQPVSSQNGGVQNVELKLAHFWPSTHPAETQLVQPWAAEIEKASNGQVKITSYPQNSLAQPEAIYKAVKSGIADIGISCFSYTRGQFPVSEVFELPGITYNNSQVASRVAWEGIQEFNPKEVQDTKLLMVLTTGPGDLYTKKPVRKLADIKGMEIRATGLSAKTLECVGATPIAMPQSDAYDALSKGMVKGNLGPIEVLQGWKQAEVTKYITKSPFLYNTLFFVTMNKDKWNSLSPENQRVVEEVTAKFFDEVAAGLWDKQNQDAMNGAIKENQMEIITLSPEETERWIKLVEPVQADYVSRMNKIGIDGQKILDRVKELADKYNQQYK
jgi:TRAP-type C4-dicarboxylate transport system substrate-binding protein